MLTFLNAELTVWPELMSLAAGSAAAYKPRKLSAGGLFRGLLSRALNPKHLYRSWRLQAGRKTKRRAAEDGQLALYARLFPNGFLHYGYFDNPEVRPEDMSLSDIEAAQERYAHKLLGLMSDKDRPVLDVGCGMGGVSRMLTEAGYQPTALTPDRKQVAHIKKTQPDLPMLHCRFEDMPAKEHAGKYGTVLTAESLQYLKLDQALPLLDEVLAPGGSWVACDYFRLRTDGDPAGHLWEGFAERLAEHGWRITHEQDVTANMLPTLRYVHMWATRFGLPLMSYGGVDRLERKQPGLHHLLGKTLDDIEGVVKDNMTLIDPEAFAARKRYMLLKMERSE